jgi:GNAT superfamily N-acetyltransferase
VNTELVIRPFRPEDRQAVLEIAADTAIFGDPVETFLEDRNLFCDFFYRYYTDYEPEHGWVACSGRSVVGFLMGSIDTKIQHRGMILHILPSSFWNILRGKYRIGLKSLRYAGRLMATTLKRENTNPDLSVYPAHLHVNIAAPWRGHGLGRRLIEGYLSQLHASDINGVHLNTTDRNVGACALYERMGFQLLDSCPTQLWADFIDEPVEKRCYGLKLIEQMPNILD